MMGHRWCGAHRTDSVKYFSVRPYDVSQLSVLALGIVFCGMILKCTTLGLMTSKTTIQDRSKPHSSLSHTSAGGTSYASI
jgi:hypothetical protein